MLMNNLNTCTLGDYVSPKCEMLFLMEGGVLCVSGASDFTDCTLDGFTNKTESYW